METPAPRRSAVLIEAPPGRFSERAQRRLAAAGFRVMTCPGPETRPGGCPLVDGLPCQLVDAADVVVHGLPRRSGASVAAALRRRHSSQAVICDPPAASGELLEHVRRASAAAGGRRREALRVRDRTIFVRAASPVDAPAYRDFDATLSERSRRLRYLGFMPALDLDRARKLTTVDFDSRFALVAVTGDDGRVVGDCRLVPCADGVAELAVAVADDMQGYGLGRLLIEAVLGVAADRGLKEVVAEVRYDNERMLKLLRSLGFTRRAWELGVVTLVRAL